MSPDASAPLNAQTEGPLSKLIINVSTYREENREFKKAMEAAKKAVRTPGWTKQQRVLGATKECLCVHKPGVDFLQESLAFLSPDQSPSEFGRRIPIRFMFGIFGTEEPSLAVEVLVRKALIPNVKLAVIEFGERFAQDVVHITESMGDCDLARIPQELDATESWEIANLFSSGDLEHIFTVKRWAKNCGVDYLSMMEAGTQVLIYSIGNQCKKTPKNPKGLQKFRAFLRRKYPHLKEKSWPVKLSNFGKKECGATHTYNEARSLLTRNLVDLRGVTRQQVKTVLRELQSVRKTATLEELLACAKNLDSSAARNQRAEMLFERLKSCALVTEKEQIRNGTTETEFFLTEAGWRIHDQVSKPAELKEVVKKLDSRTGPVAPPICER